MLLFYLPPHLYPQFLFPSTPLQEPPLFDLVFLHKRSVKIYSFQKQSFAKRRFGIWQKWLRNSAGYWIKNTKGTLVVKVLSLNCLPGVPPGFPWMPLVYPWPTPSATLYLLILSTQATLLATWWAIPWVTIFPGLTPPRAIPPLAYLCWVTLPGTSSYMVTRTKGLKLFTLKKWIYNW